MVVLAMRAMGGESKKAWREVLGDLIARALHTTPALLIIDGGEGL